MFTENTFFHKEDIKVERGTLTKENDSKIPKNKLRIPSDKIGLTIYISESAIDKVNMVYPNLSPQKAIVQFIYDNLEN